MVDPLQKVIISLVEYSGRARGKQIMSEVNRQFIIFSANNIEKEDNAGPLSLIKSC